VALYERRGGRWRAWGTHTAPRGFGGEDLTRLCIAFHFSWATCRSGSDRRGGAAASCRPALAGACAVRRERPHPRDVAASAWSLAAAADRLCVSRLALSSCAVPAAHGRAPAPRRPAPLPSRSGSLVPQDVTMSSVQYGTSASHPATEFTTHWGCGSGFPARAVLSLPPGQPGAKLYTDGARHALRERRALYICTWLRSAASSWPKLASCATSGWRRAGPSVRHCSGAGLRPSLLWICHGCRLRPLIQMSPHRLLFRSKC